jgi:hypothetical protein
MTKEEVDDVLSYAESLRERFAEYGEDAIIEADGRDLVLLADEIKRLRATISQAIDGHKVWESIYGSSPTSRAHLKILEDALAGSAHI